MPKLKQRQPNRYEAIILRLFEDHYSKGITEFEFTRKEFIDIAIALGIELPSNVGDVIYNFRYRNELPDKIRDTVPAGIEWIIEGAGRRVIVLFRCPYYCSGTSQRG